MARDYHKLYVWKLSYDFCLDLYKITEKYPKLESENLVSQIRRAATSIPLNIAEGTSRFSKKSMLQFMNYAYGSCKELQVCLMLSRDLKYITSEEFLRLNDKLQILSIKLFKFTQVVEKEKFYDFFKQ